MVVHKPISSSFSQQTGSCQWNLGAGHFQNPNYQDYLSLLVTPEDTSPSNQELTQKQQTLTSNILSATITNNKSLAAIFLFEIEEPSSTPVLNGAALDKKPITTIYTNAKVDGRQVNRAASARIITANGATKTPIGKIDDFPFEVNGIMTPIKVLVMEATQYQALGQHICVPAMCGYFKTSLREKLLIKLEEEKEKPIWEAYQVSWANADHNKLPPILSWDNKKKKKEEKLVWKPNLRAWSDDSQSKLTAEWSWEEKGKEKK
ncbi:hypothetical protein G9A89_020533 [Geosiphon pyriformis]|nr:hypothetical protein G9A89_020533 [Geosiphon pyriformis]